MNALGPMLDLNSIAFGHVHKGPCTYTSCRTLLHQLLSRERGFRRLLGVSEYALVASRDRPEQRQ